MNLKKRWIAVMLACVLLFGAMPARAETAEEKESLRNHLQTMYYKICGMSGLSSMRGYCGLMVGCQLYLTGIDSTFQSRDGKHQYNAYCDLEMSTGGYLVQAYPSWEYSLTDLLNHLTNYGTRDVYNILVGFQSVSSSADGAKYGHAMFIHAILDGEVYFFENFPMYYDGWSHPVGYPHVMSIAQFGAYYDGWSEYEGSVYFGSRQYAEQCTAYTTDLLLRTMEAAPLYSQPSEEHGEVLRTAAATERFHAVGIYENPEGGLYYEVEENGHSAYIAPEHVQVLEQFWSGVQVSDIVAPQQLRRYKGFHIAGRLTADACYMEKVTVSILRQVDGAQVLQCSANVFGTRYELAWMDDWIRFSNLAQGVYLYRISVTVPVCWIEDGQIRRETRELVLHTSEFRVSGREDGHTVTYDPGAGVCELAWAVRESGGTLGELPQPRREGYRFAGWFLENGEQVYENTVITRSLALQARWTPEKTGGWHYEDGAWRFLAGGEIQTGWICTDGVYYHINADGVPDTGWVEMNGQLRFFSDAGAMAAGWIRRGDGISYLRSSGCVATGWIETEGERHYLDEQGMLCTGWQDIGGKRYYLAEDGAASGWQNVDGTLYCFAEDGSLTARMGTTGTPELYNPETGAFVRVLWQGITH